MRTHVELISTGSELLSGRTLNRHAHYLGDRLARLGLRLVRDTTVPDDLDLICETVREALARADLVLISGGLGPTSDDLTRDAVASLLGRSIVTDQEALESMRKRYEAGGRVLLPTSERQALVLEGAEVLLNRVGAAPGQCIRLEGKLLFVLPGPPRELDAVFTDHVEPRLRDAFPGAAALAENVFMLTGIPEADAAARLEDAGLPLDPVDLGYCAAPGRLEIRMNIPEGAGAVADSMAATIQDLLGPYIFAEERINLEEAVVRLLRENKVTVATAESCTGGLIGARLTDVTGSSDVYLGGIIAYSNRVKTKLLEVSPHLLENYGAVSEVVARDMAEGARVHFRSDLALGVTGVAGPGGGTPEKPVGTVCMGLASSRGSTAHTFHFPGDRAWVRERSVIQALTLLRDAALAHLS